MTALLAITMAAALALWLRAARQRNAARRREARTFVRSWKRRSALVRVARYCRAIDLTLGSAISAGIELGRQLGDRDAAIDALTARIAELMPCRDRIAFVDGELPADRAAAFRVHLRGCAACRQAMPEDVQLAARLSTLTPADNADHPEEGK